MAYGFSMIYGATGEINLREIARVTINRGLLDTNFILITGAIMSLIGFAFKAGAVPFHWWAPDTYEGSPTIITALITTIAKIAAFAGLLRFLFVGFNGFSKSLWIVLFIIALSLLSAILGNLMALPQKNFKRLMAYSSIAHAGYILIGFAVASVDAQFAIFIYLMAYIAMNLGVFAVAMLVERTRKSEDIAAFAGIGHTNPFISICMIIFLISMVGLPPFAGFLGKLFIFKAGVENNLTWLVIIGVLTSVISLWYYVNIIKHMFFVKYEGTSDTVKIRAPGLSVFIIAVLAVFTLAMVIVPSVFILLSKNAAVFF
jgi:NADH-quinone oxidoreductase subunit N